MNNDNFIEIANGLWYEKSSGLPYSTIVNNIYDVNYYGKKLTKLTPNSYGYYRVKINGKSYMWHRLVWEYFNGKIPQNMFCDHKNNDRSNNRIDNLQLLNPTDNNRKRLKKINGKSPYLGVSYCRKRTSFKKWRALINFNKKSILIGYFETPEEAYVAYLETKEKLHGKHTIIHLISNH